jgi:peptide/nickel transport system substrate-binding protein
VSAGPFLFGERMPGERIRLVRNPAYWKGAPQMDEWHFAIIADPEQQVERLLAGEVDLAPVAREQTAQVAAVTNLTPYAFPDNSFSFIALNLADPANPQPGHDANNALVRQAPHPILGDQRVRQAIAHGVDSPQILNEIYRGYSFRLSSYLLPTIEWAYAGDLAPYDLAPTNAATLLTAAGWVDSNGDGVRERNGQPLQLTLLTNNDSPQRMRIGEMVQEQLAVLGIAIRFEAVPFEAMTATLFDQRFDMAVIGWENLGPDPATSAFWHSQADVPGAGLNFVSFQDAEVDTWLDDAAQSADCTPERRAPLYRQVQQRIYAAVPYVFLGGPLQIWVSTSHWQTVRPQAWGLAIAD